MSDSLYLTADIKDDLFNETIHDPFELATYGITSVLPCFEIVDCVPYLLELPLDDGTVFYANYGNVSRTDPKTIYQNLIHLAPGCANHITHTADDHHYYV